MTLSQIPARRKDCTIAGQVHHAHFPPYQPPRRIHELVLARCSLIRALDQANICLSLSLCPTQEGLLDTLAMEATTRPHLLHRLVLVDSTALL